MGADTEANAEHLDKEFTQVKDAIYSVNENQLAMLKQIEAIRALVDPKDSIAARSLSLDSSVLKLEVLPEIRPIMETSNALTFEILPKDKRTFGVQTIEKIPSLTACSLGKTIFADEILPQSPQQYSKQLNGIKLPTIEDMLSGTHRIVNNLKITMPHPSSPTRTIECVFSGETVNGRPHGMGEFKWKDEYKEGRGMGMFNNGLLHGHVLVNDRGMRWSCEYREGIRNGFGKLYYWDGRKGKVNKQE